MSKTGTDDAVVKSPVMRRAHQAGFALTQVIILGAAFFGLAVASLTMSRSDQMISNNVVNGMKAFWAASGGLDVAEAWLANGGADDSCIADGDCADLPLEGTLLDESASYRVTINDTGSRLVIRSVGTGPNNARKVVEAIVLAPFFQGDQGLIQIDGDRLSGDLEDPRGEAPGNRIPGWTIDGRNHDPETLELADVASCPDAPPIGGPFDDADTAMQNELDKMRCSIVQRANECCAADGTTLPDSETCQWRAGFCQPGTCDTLLGGCAAGTCTYDVAACAPGPCAGDENCVAANCPVTGCQPGSCVEGDAYCASGNCLVDGSSCQQGTCEGADCAPGTCAVTCTQGTCPPGSLDCIPGECRTNGNGACAPGDSCNGKNCTEATCAIGACGPGGCTDGNCVAGTCPIVAGSCNSGACPAGGTCPSAACTIEACQPTDCTTAECAAGSCPAACGEGGTCEGSSNCISATCSLPDCVDFCGDNICEDDPGLAYVRGDGLLPRYQTPYWTDKDLRVADLPPTWATNCSAPDPFCCETMPLEDAGLRATALAPAYPNQPMPPAPSDRGPLRPDTPGDLLDDFPVKVLGDLEREHLAEKVDGILEAALAAPAETKRCITSGRISGESLTDLGTLSDPKIVIVADPGDNDPRMAALSAECPGAQNNLNNLTIDGNSVVQGAGILIVPRNLVVKDASFVWKGLVVVLERARIEAWDAACGGIWGGVLVQKAQAASGNDARLELDKNLESPGTCSAPNNAFSINYSCDAIAMANELTFRTLAWTEVFGE